MAGEEVTGGWQLAPPAPAHIMALSRSPSRRHAGLVVSQGSLPPAQASGSRGQQLDPGSQSLPVSQLRASGAVWLTLGRHCESGDTSWTPGRARSSGRSLPKAQGGAGGPGHSAVGQAGAQPLGVRAFGTLQPTWGRADTGDPGRHPGSSSLCIAADAEPASLCMTVLVSGRAASDPPVSSVRCPQRHLACFQPFKLGMSLRGQDGAVTLCVFLLSPQGFYDFSPGPFKREL